MFIVIDFVILTLFSAYTKLNKIEVVNVENSNIDLLTISSANVSKNVDEDCLDESQISGDTYCYEIYDPVCGCNRATYSNNCYAEKAGITEWTEGECE